MSAEPHVSGTADVGAGDQSVTVLVVDDNQVVLRLCRRLLEKAGYKVLTVSDGLEAVSVALANSPDVILMDVAMPGIDGLEATRRIKDQRPDIAIVIVSVLATPGNRERFMAAGAHDVMMKPVRLSDLITVVAKLTSIRSAATRASERPKTKHEELRRSVGQLAEIAALTSQFPIPTAHGKPQFDFGMAAASVEGFHVALTETRRVLGEIARAHGALREYVPNEKLDVWRRVRLLPGTELNELPWTATLAAKKSAARLLALARSIALETDAASKEQRDWSWNGAERMFTTQLRPAMYELSRCEWDELIQGKYIHEFVDQVHALTDLVQRQLLSPPKPNRPADEIRRPGSAHEEHVYGAYRWCAVCGWIELMAAPIGVHTLNKTPSEPTASRTTVATFERNSRGFGSSHELNEGLRKAIEHFINLMRARNPHNPAAVSAEPQRSGTVKDATLDLAMQALDARDPYTASHSSRVSELAGLLGEHLGLGDREVELLRTAGSLHDLGMIGVRDDVLNKPGSLTDKEWEVLRRHPDIGADMLAQHPALAEVATLVRHHHESWDGGGYPAGLKGDVIPFGARILAVADSFDAITSERFFIRSAMTPIEAVDDISRRAGHRYDLIVVNALRELHGLRPL